MFSIIQLGFAPLITLPLITLTLSLVLCCAKFAPSRRYCCLHTYAVAFSVEYDPDTLCVQLRQRQHEIMRLHDVRLIRLVKVDVRTSGAKECGEDEIEFASGKTDKYPR